ncbi:MAG: hypothetical protein WA063_07205 [Minisyncoccia bacterium]
MYNVWLNEGTGKCMIVEDISCLPPKLQIEALSNTIVFLSPMRGSQDDLLDLIKRADTLLELIESETKIAEQKERKDLAGYISGKVVSEALAAVRVLCWIICKGHNLFNLYETCDEKPLRFYEAVHRIIQKENKGEKFWEEVIVDNILKTSTELKANKGFYLEKIKQIIDVFGLSSSDPKIIEALQNL